VTGRVKCFTCPQAVHFQLSDRHSGSLGYNLSSDAAGGDNTTAPGGVLNATGDICNADPVLGPLQDNGGPTFTQALLTGSPAIDKGYPNFDPNNFNPPMIYDQRGSGFNRVVNGRIDIGAFEVQVLSPIQRIRHSRIVLMP